MTQCSERCIIILVERTGAADAQIPVSILFTGKSETGVKHELTISGFLPIEPKQNMIISTQVENRGSMLRVQHVECRFFGKESGIFLHAIAEDGTQKDPNMIARDFVLCGWQIESEFEL